jgi:hypothetical protein
MSTKVIPSQKFKSLFAGYRKKAIFVNKLSDNEPRRFNTASYWDGGSKTDHHIYNLASGQLGIPPVGSYPMFQAEYILKPGEIHITTGCFCGKPATAFLDYFPCDEEKVKEFFN